jgi:HSP20 family molecular chaperone IbpA
MADSIQNKKLQQSTYLRQIQQEKSAKKRELMAQQQQDLVSMRQFYANELKNVDNESAAAVDNIRQETKDMVQLYSDEKRMEKENERQQKLDAQVARQEEQKNSNSASESSVEQTSTYNRNAQKKPMLQNYETKETDDFYRVQNRGSRVTENQKQYIIEAYAPEHEKDNLRVSVQRNKAIVSGKRKFGDSVEEGNKKMSTHNFQTFREEFKFGRPVSHEGMTRERVGDFVRFTIPKLEALDSPDDKS